MAKIYTKVKVKWQNNLEQIYRKRTFNQDYICIESLARIDNWRQGLPILSKVQVHRVIVVDDVSPSIIPIVGFNWNHVTSADSALAFAQLPISKKVDVEEMELLKNITNALHNGNTIFDLDPSDWVSEKDFIESEYTRVKELEGIKSE